MSGIRAGIIRSDFRGLNDLVKTLGDGDVVRVGILAKKAGRYEAGSLKKEGGHRVNKGTKADFGNAELGAVHEFGSISKRIPKRSFLRMPIFQNAEQIISDAAEALPRAVEQGTMRLVLKRIGIACEAAVQKAFATRGFGRWAPDKPATVLGKKSSSPLIDTGQLRRSIASEVGRPR